MPRTSTTKAKSPRRTKTPAPAVAEFQTPAVELVTEPEVVSTKVMMTPKWASEILAKNTKNRPLRPARVERYASDMRDGRWKLNGESVILSDKDNLMNGQHRLHAVVSSGVTVPMMLTLGVDESAFATMDAGMNRTAGDVLGMRGIANFNQVAAMTRLVLNYRDDAPINRPRSPQQIEDAVAEHPEFEQYATTFGSLFNIGRSVAVACCMIADRFGEGDQSEQIAEFAHGVSSGANLATYDPRLVYRNKMMAMNADRQRRPEQSVVWYFTQRALSHHLNGSKLAKLATQRNTTPYFSEIPSATREMVRAKW